MVSRSLEKMMLIAIGLSTAVIIGVPVLLYAINTMSYTAHFQDAQMTAEDIFAAANRIDSGELENLTIQVHIPAGVSISAAGNTLTITLVIEGQLTIWSETFDHQVSLNAPTAEGYYNIVFTMVSNVIHITHSLISI